jgi:hypothetical protein
VKENVQQIEIWRVLPRKAAAQFLNTREAGSSGAQRF